MTRQQNFNMHAQKINLLTENDPAPYAIHKGKSPVLFTGPHNGHAVPKALPACMDTEKEWFNKAHEAVDLHVAELFEVLQSDMALIAFFRKLPIS